MQELVRIHPADVEPCDMHSSRTHCSVFFPERITNYLIGREASGPAFLRRSSCIHPVAKEPGA